MKNKIFRTALVVAALLGTWHLAPDTCRAQSDGRVALAAEPGARTKVYLEGGELAAGVPLSAGSIKMSDCHTNVLVGYSTNSWSTWMGDVWGDKRLLFRADGSFFLGGTNGDRDIALDFKNYPGNPAMVIGPVGLAANRDTALLWERGHWELRNHAQTLLYLATNAYPLVSDDSGYRLRYPGTNLTAIGFGYPAGGAGEFQLGDLGGVKRMWWTDTAVGFKSHDGVTRLTIKTNQIRFTANVVAANLILTNAAGQFFQVGINDATNGFTFTPYTPY